MANFIFGLATSFWYFERMQKKTTHPIWYYFDIYEIIYIYIFLIKKKGKAQNGSLDIMLVQWP